MSVILDLRGSAISVIDAWFAVAPPNSSTYLLPVLASEIGRDAAHPRFDYFAASYSFDSKDAVDLMLTGSDAAGASGLARFNLFDNPISQGDFYSLAPGASVNVDVSVDTSRYHPKVGGQKGWMTVNVDGADGPGQARLIRVGSIAH